jgi:uncharacterized membrane protein
MTHNRRLPAVPHTQVQKTVFSAKFEGPLPTPDAFAGYENVLPGAAERILKMAESQADHRRDMERVIINSNIKKEKRGQSFAFLALLATLLTAAACAYLEQPIPASVLGTGGIGGIIIAFITGARKPEKEKLKGE